MIFLAYPRYFRKVTAFIIDYRRGLVTYGVNILIFGPLYVDNEARLRQAFVSNTMGVSTRPAVSSMGVSPGTVKKG